MKTEICCLPSKEAFEGWLDPTAKAVLEIEMCRGLVGPEEALPLPVSRARDRIREHRDLVASNSDEEAYGALVCNPLHAGLVVEPPLPRAEYLPASAQSPTTVADVVQPAAVGT